MSKKILAVDDDIKILELVDTILSGNDYEVVKVSDGKTAVQTALSEKPNLIIMDIMLPDISGPEAVQELLNDISTQNIPVIFLSGIADVEEGAETSSVNVGGKYYTSIAKPFSPDVLLNKIQEAI